MTLHMFLYKVDADKDLKKGTWELCGYWHNAYQIHKYFHDNIVQGGDPQAFYVVNTEFLDKLKLLCYIILMNQHSEVEKEVADALLPNVRMLNKIKIDEKYFYSIEQTYTILSEISEEDSLFLYREG